MEDTVKVTYAGKVNVLAGNNPRSLYEHQIDALENMSRLDEKNKFSSLLVLPTGGGKTVTAVYWLLKEGINKKKKILWLAHRHLLLEQAAGTFQNNAYSNILYNISSFNYRIVSGRHDKPINISSKDDVLIISKDSIVRNLNILNDWLKAEEDVYLVIDEAHHATAKSYRKVIEYVKEKVPNTRLLGLTATPFRTVENEQGLLAKIFTDGIIFKVDLKDLIKKDILSRPEFEECLTEVELGKHMGLNALRSIEQLDSLPEDVADEIANHKERNKMIVNKYAANSDKYDSTLVFAVNRMHAFTLKALFEKQGIRSEVIVSGTKAEFIGIDISDRDNERCIEDYRKGKIKVLINVNILTEGVDLPKTKTVFLTRPTVSGILMTQMIGRALRGEKAGGTKEAHIVSFIDKWQERIAWVNAETLIEEENEFEDNNDSSYEKRQVRLISIAKIEEFAKIMDETVDTSKLEAVEFMKRVPLGMYVFTFIDDDKMERNYQVLIYDSTKPQYEQFISELPLFFDEYGIDDEIIDEGVLNELVEATANTYFDDYMLPSYDKKDIRSILKYYAQKGCEPSFIPFEEIDRKQLDLAEMAKEIVEKDMRRSEMKAYIDDMWENEESIVRIYFNKKLYFTRQMQTEIAKLEGDFEISETFSDVEHEQRPLNALSMYEMGKIAPERAREIKEKIYLSYRKSNGNYYCKECNYESSLRAMFQIDHIKPMAKGGLTEVTNLQLLCRKCNVTKGDRYE